MEYKSILLFIKDEDSNQEVDDGIHTSNKQFIPFKHLSIQHQVSKHLKQWVQWIQFNYPMVFIRNNGGRVKYWCHVHQDH